MQCSIPMEHSYSVLSGSTCPNGRTVEGWEHFDQIISKFMVEQKIPGASVAVSKKGNILYQQGYGVAGAGCRVHHDSMFRIASISKPVTAAIIVQLLDRLKLPLNTKVFGKTGILKSYRTRDKRMKNITVRHLLQHSAGWDRDKVGDAVFVRPQCVVKEHPDSQSYNSALLAYALRRKLQFSPGTWHSYSNLGYLVLGEVIEALSGQPYHRVLQSFLQDLHIHGITVGKRGRVHYKCIEVEYFNNREAQVVTSLYPEEGMVLPQYGGMAVESSASYGGLVADAASLLKFINCMEEAVSQCNTSASRVQLDSTVKDALSTKTGAELPGPETVGRHDLCCQPAQQLTINAVESKNCHGNGKVNQDSHCDHYHANQDDLTGVSSSIFLTSSEATINDRHLGCLNKSDTSFVLSDNLVEEPVYKQIFSSKQDVYNVEHGLIMNASDIVLKKTNTDCVDNTSQSDIFGESNASVTPQMNMQYQRDTFLHQNVCLCGRQCNASDMICQPKQQYDSSTWQCNSSVICQSIQQHNSSNRQCNSNDFVCQFSQHCDSRNWQFNSSGICRPSQKYNSGDMQCNSSGICQDSQNYDSNGWQCNSTIIREPNQKYDSSDSQYNYSVVGCEPGQNFDSNNSQHNSSAVGCEDDQNVDSSDCQYNSSIVGCEPGQNFDSSDCQYNSCVVGCEPGQNFDSSDCQYNSCVVGCEPGQNFDSVDWQDNSNPDICQPYQTSEMYVDKKCDTCSLKITARECSIADCNSNRHINHLKPLHLLTVIATN